ncbi:MAG TPA: hypothetical protein VIL18_08575 [Longimicrobiales bacterium]
MAVEGAAASHRVRAVTIRELLEMKRRGERIVAPSVYDHLLGRLLGGAGVRSGYPAARFDATRFIDDIALA